MSHAFTVGDRVRVISLPTFVKTAEPMPMLRPPTVITLGEEGTIVEQRPNYWSVRFSNGTYLIDGKCLEVVAQA